ncbi:MAG TPA: LLM class flavin-dependent oxidoreductase [Acidimicrobiales bacterium]|nr:LLM class flavin-dependent oxidoreductase [Acidimicrobiales bacterium]
MADTNRLHLAVALDGAGWHPAAWREPDARPEELFTAGYWVDLARRAERGLLDLVTIEDGLRLQSDDPREADQRTDRVRGRLDAVLVAARVAPLTEHVGLVPAATVTHTEPFHLSKAIATLDYISLGRAGIRAQVSGRADEAAHFGRREFPVLRRQDFSIDNLSPQVAQHFLDLFDEAADYVEVLRRLWDSWEDDAEIRDAATGRFIDRDKLHYIDFEGRWFSVRGPSITPRPPQGQPIVAALAHRSPVFQFVGRSADIGFVTPSGTAQIGPVLDEIRVAQRQAGRADETVHVFGDLVVFLDSTTSRAQARKSHLDELAGTEYTSDALAFVGTPEDLADLLAEWHGAGLSGFRLRPGALPHDLAQVTDVLVPALQARHLFRTDYEAATLRGLLGLPRPANRYAAASVTA